MKLKMSKSMALVFSTILIPVLYYSSTKIGIVTLGGIGNFLDIVGPTFYIFLPSLIYVVYMFILGISGVSRELKFNYLKYVKEAAPIVGLLGTVLGLIMSLNGLDVSADTQKVLIKVIRYINQGLGSTGAGIIIGLFAWITEDLFYVKEKELDLRKKLEEIKRDNSLLKKDKDRLSEENKKLWAENKKLWTAINYLKSQLTN